MYDRAHGTLEGLSARYGTVGDVAPQGLQDLGTTEDTGPVGTVLGGAEGSERPVDDASGDVPPAVDDPSHASDGYAPNMPGSVAVPDPPDVGAHDASMSMAHIPLERPDNLPEFIPWPYPDHWRVRPDAQEVIHKAEQFMRPNGTPHPDVFYVHGRKATIVRGRLIRDYLGGSRIPDVDKDDWFGQPQMRAEPKRTYEATGDHQRSPHDGPAPVGWSSYQGHPAVPVMAVPAKGLDLFSG